MSKLSLKFFILLLLLSLGACQTTPPEVIPQPQVAIAPPTNDQKPAQLPAEPEPKPDPEHTLYMLAIGAAKNDKLKIAIRYFNKLIQLNPEFKLAYTNLGLTHMQMNQHEQAKKAFTDAIKRDKSDAIAYNHLAVIQRQEGLFKLARENYNRAIKADPEYASAHLNLGILLDIYLQKLPKALEHYLMFQKLTGNKDDRIEKWVLDIKRRIDSRNKKTSG